MKEQIGIALGAAVGAIVGVVLAEWIAGGNFWVRVVIIGLAAMIGTNVGGLLARR